MKTKFLLTLLTLNGLLFGTNSAFAVTVSEIDLSQNTARLSQNIAKSIGFDRDTHSLVEFAINRALIAQKLGDCQAQNPSTTKSDLNQADKPQLIRGRMPLPTPQTSENPIDKVTVPDPTKPSTTPVAPSVRRARLIGARG
jgi:hypothetical protein